MYEPRFYRKQMKAIDLVSFMVCLYETDLKIFAEKDLTDLCTESVKKYRQEITEYIHKRPAFYRSLVPVSEDKQAPLIIQHMIKASRQAGVGPMAAVAGAIAEYVGKELLLQTENIIIENGGDIFLKSSNPRTLNVYSGASKLTGRLFLEIASTENGLGICTSSGTIGHSLSMGKADAVVVRSADTLLADAAATAIGNLINTTDDIQTGIDFAKSIKGVDGVLIVVSSSFGAWGNIRFKEDK